MSGNYLVEVIPTNCEYGDLNPVEGATSHWWKILEEGLVMPEASGLTNEAGVPYRGMVSGQVCALCGLFASIKRRPKSGLFYCYDLGRQWAKDTFADEVAARQVREAIKAWTQVTT